MANALGLLAVPLPGFSGGLALRRNSIVFLHNHLHYLARVLLPGRQLPRSRLSF